MSSKASDIAATVASRLATIKVVNGYNTDIGLRVFRGRMSLNVKDLPCIVLAEDADTVQEIRGTKVRLTQRYTIEGHDNCDPLQPNDKAHEILQDIKRAIFGGDLSFGGALRPNDLAYSGRSIAAREDGTAICAASVDIDISYVEDLSDP
jgi:hypothetical protein